MASNPITTPRRSPRLAAQTADREGNGPRRLSYSEAASGQASCGGPDSTPRPGRGSKRKELSPILEASGADEGRETARMRDIMESDPDLEMADSDEDDVQQELGRDDQGGDGVMDGLAVCCVPVCKVGQPIRVADNQHKGKTCDRHFHAMCAFAHNGCDDLSQCGCHMEPDPLPEPEKAPTPEPEEVEVPQDLEPPENLTAEEQEIWLDAVDLTRNHRVCPKHFLAVSTAQKIWADARTERKKYKDRNRKKKAGKGAQCSQQLHQGHAKDPEYRAAYTQPIGLPMSLPVLRIAWGIREWKMLSPSSWRGVTSVLSTTTRSPPPPLPLSELILTG